MTQQQINSLSKMQRNWRNITMAQNKEQSAIQKT